MNTAASAEESEPFLQHPANATRQIAERFGCTVLDNPRVQQEYAKYIGFTGARGKAAIFIDSDESFESELSLAARAQVMRAHPDYRFVMSSGYRKPPGASAVNDYINMFSDPFAYFMSGVSGEAGLFEEGWRKRFEVVEEGGLFTGFVVPPGAIQPTVDMAAGNTVDLEFLSREFAREMESSIIIPRIFYLVAGAAPRIALLKGDAIVHYSADSMRTYLNKLDWRVKVNIHYKDIPGTGYSNREQYQPARANAKKLLFLPYALTFVAPLAQGIAKAGRLRRPVALLHPFFTFYVGVDIVWQQALKMMGRKPSLKTYGKQEQELDLD